MFQQEEIGMQRNRTERDDLKVTPIRKIVIRHLPPTMTEEEFLQQVDPLPEHDSYYFSEADWSLGLDATCRAYITFKNDEDVFLFRDRFDGYVFVDKKGNEYAAIVEFAPFQGFGKCKTRYSDKIANTIEQQPHYEEFLKKLEEKRVAASKSGENKLQFTLITKKEKITTTPLLEYLARKNERRREESKKRLADKKKGRGDDKDKRKQNQAPTLVQPVQILTEGSYRSRCENSDQRPAQANNEVKNAHARRKEERNRLRHVAHLQRKKTRKEQREAFYAGQSKIENYKILVKSSNEDEANVGNFQYGDSQKPIEILRESQSAEMFSEQEKNVIFSPESILSVDNASSSDIKDNPKDDVKELENIISKLAINNETKEVEKEINKFEFTERENLGNQRGKWRDKRRLRYRDPPAIGIYSPKARLRVSEENVSSSMLAKGMLSLSIADGEKDEPPKPKKVLRYSERPKAQRKSLPKQDGCDDIAQGN